MLSTLCTAYWAAHLQHSAREHRALALDGEAVVDGEQKLGAQLARLSWHHAQQLCTDCLQALCGLLQGLIGIPAPCDRHHSGEGQRGRLWGYVWT